MKYIQGHLSPCGRDIPLNDPALGLDYLADKT